MGIEIVYIREDLILSWRVAREAVGRERVYLGRLRFPPFDPGFALRMIQNDWPMYAAMDGADLVGWADVTPVDIPECVHRGALGMGVLASHRGRGAGSGLLAACLAHAPPRSRRSSCQSTPATPPLSRSTANLASPISA